MEVIELNEAFAAQALAVTRDLGLPDDSRSGESQWRRDCHRPPSRRKRRAARHDRDVSAHQNESAVRALHDVHRSGAGHRHDPGTLLKSCGLGERRSRDRASQNEAALPNFFTNAATVAITSFGRSRCGECPQSRSLRISTSLETFSAIDSSCAIVPYSSSTP